MTIMVPDWKQILRKAWSVRLIILAGMLTGLEAVRVIGA